MSRARDFADLAGAADAGGLTGRNLIINGAFQCWQRTTSVTTSGSGTFSADRWASNAGASTVFSRSTDVPTGFQFSISVAGSAFTGIRTRIEAADCKKLAGQKATFSWYAKRTAGTGDMRTYLAYASAEDNFGTVTLIEDVVNTASASVSSDWARYTYTVTMPVNAANGLQFIVYNGSASGSVTTLYTGVQLEVGEQATPFEHEPYGVTLQKAKRYYQRWEHTGTPADQPIGAGVWYTSTQILALLTYDEMRAAPTFTASSTGFVKAYGGGFAEVRTGGNGVDTIGAKTARFNFTLGARTAGHGTLIQLVNSGDYLELDAEL